MINSNSPSKAGLTNGVLVTTMLMQYLQLVELSNTGETPSCLRIKHHFKYP